MKTAISIPDDLFAEADRLARRLNQSRSQLYSRAIREYVARHSDDEVTAALNAVLEDVGSADAGFIGEAARQAAERIEW
jgi:metal-responsive CopG/Arc/MetJ family transcriptional regulator